MKYISLFLAAFTLLTLTEGCIVMDPVKSVKKAIFGKSKKPDKKFKKDPNLTKEERKARIEWCKANVSQTAEQKVRSLLGLGATAGGALFIVPLILLFVTKINSKMLIKTSASGLLLVVLSIVFDKYLIVILISVIVLGALLAAYYIYRNWEKVKKMALMTDEVIKRGNLSHEQIHGAANKTIGPAGTKDRVAIKQAADAARKLQEA